MPGICNCPLQTVSVGEKSPRARLSAQDPVSTDDGWDSCCGASHRTHTYTHILDRANSSMCLSLHKCMLSLKPTPVAACQQRWRAPNSSYLWMKKSFEYHISTIKENANMPTSYVLTDFLLQQQIKHPHLEEHKPDVMSHAVKRSLVSLLLRQEKK